MAHGSTRIHSELSVVELPTGKPRPAVQTEPVPLRVPAELTKRLCELAQRQGATLLVTLLSAWAVLLGRWSGQEELIIGTRAATRRRPEITPPVSVLENAAAARFRLQEDATVEQLLNQVRTTVAEACAHRDMPFERVVEALKPVRNEELDIQVLIGPNDIPAVIIASTERKVPGLKPVEISAENAQQELPLSLCGREEGLTGTLEYAGDLFERETIARMKACWEVLLEEMVAGVRQPISRLTILTAAEREQVLYAFNDTAMPYPHDRLIHQFFEEQVRRTPAAVAVICGNQRLTYAELNGRANQLARYLAQKGVGPDQLVGIYVERGIETVVGLLGVSKAGGAYVPLDPAYPSERLAFMIRDAAPRVLLTQERLRNTLPSTAAEVIALDSDWSEIAVLETGDLDPRWLHLTSRHLAYVIYTSGSTGEPKGVAAEHRGMVNRIVAQATIGAFRSDDICCQKTSIGFVDAIFEILGPLSYGRPLVLASEAAAKDVQKLASLIEREHITRLLTVPSLAQSLLESAEAMQSLRGLRSWTLSGEELKGELLRKLRERLPECTFTNLYGSSEVAADVTCYVCQDTDDSRVPIGRPIANTQIYILDRHLHPVPIGVAGEIYIGGAGVARGYLNRPELTAERFVADPFCQNPSARLYKSGDLGRWRADGTIEYLGRNDQQVKIRGFRIELVGIEAQLSRHAQVKEVVVVAREDVAGEKRLVGYVVGDRKVALQAASDSGSGRLRNATVSGWETLWKETYGTSSTAGPSFVGWNSSYSGEPIPEPQMEEWLASTVEQVQALRPGKVLEIGCGVGLVLQHVAPQCAVYVGTDISTLALERLRQWMSGREDLDHVELLHRSATELQDLPSGSFDTVVLNSVVQYFPDVEYLLVVLQEAVRLLGPGGKIFIGDVRHLGLLPMFHSAVQLDKAAATVSVGQLRRRIARAVAQDKELVIDPQFFQVLAGRVAGISAAEVYLKRGRSPNELTRYRYDVVLHVGEHMGACAVCEPLEWRTAVGSVEELEAALSERRWRAVRLHSIPNLRLAREAATQRLIELSDEQLEAGALRRRLDELQFDDIDPERFRELGQAYGYDVTVSWSTRGLPGCFEVQLLDRTRADRIPRAVPSSTDAVKPWSTYANDPLEDGFRQQLIPELREYLKRRLPEYMIPSAWMVLKELPLTPNGKVDRGALPAPQGRPEEMGEYIAPRTEVERILADIWAQLLRVDRVGVQDNFFELGGHSLLIVQMMERLRRAGLSAKVRSVYESPTLADLAGELTTDPVRQLDVPPNLIPAGCEVITPRMLPLVELEPEHIERIVQSVPGGAGNVQDIYPLAPMQEGILFHHLLNEQGGDTYVLPTLLSLPSREKLEEFVRALQQVIDRHDILRTAVLWEQLPQPVQVVCRRAILPVEELVLDRDREAIAQFEERMRPERRRLELRQAPLMRLQVAADVHGTQWYALLQTHHLVCDNESVEILIAEVMAFFEGRSEGLPEPVAYRHHVAQALAHARLHDAEAFFRDKLGDIDEPTAPFGLRDVHGDGSRIEEAHQVLDPALGRRVRARARHLGVSAATLFHAAWGLAVSCTSGRDDVVFGSVLLGRLQGSAGAQRILGMFINTLPLRLRLRDVTAKELVEQTQRELAELLNHEQASLAVAQRCSELAGATPLFSALLNYRHSAPDSHTERSTMASGVQVLVSHEWTNYPLALSVDDRGEEFGLTMQTDRRIDPHRMLGYVSTTLQSLVEALEEAPQRPALVLSILPEREWHQVVKLFNATQATYPRAKPIQELFDEQVRRTPDAVAAVYEEQTLTYAELNSRANRLAHYLSRQGVEVGEYIPILMPRCLQMLIAQLAVLKSGGVYVPMDDTLPAERQAFMIRDCGARRVLAEQALPAGLEQESVQWIDCLELADELEDLPGHNLILPLDEPPPAAVMYTSGSTGVPKGVMVPHRAVNRLVINNGYARIEPTDCVAHCSNPAFDASIFEIWGALLNGARVVIVPPPVVLEAGRFAEVLGEHRVTVLWLTAGLFAQYAEALAAVFGRLRYLLTGGDVVEPGAVRRVLRDSPPRRLLNGYGPTECTTFSTTYPIEAVDEETKRIPIGKPVSNTRIYILDGHLRPVPIGVTGEIYIGGAGVALGYLNRPALTAERFILDPFSTDPEERLYKSGDLGRWRADGNIEFLGRNDSQVKLRGFRIELGEIEAQLVRHAQVEEAAVVAREDVPGEKRLVAYVTGRDEGGPDVEGLRAHLKAVLPDYMVPGAIVTLDGLPLTPNGKLDRRALPAPELGAYVSREYEAPQGEVEQMLASIWQELLRVERVGRQDNFFELGGHSLLATRVISRIRELVQVDLSLRALFDAPTIEQLSLRVENEGRRQAARETSLRIDSLARNFREQINEMDDDAVLTRITQLEKELGYAKYE